MKTINVQLMPVTMANRGDLDDIDPGDPARYQVHSNWYWHQWSLDNPHVMFRLVHVEGEPSAVGMVAFGPFFTDRHLKEIVPGEYEIFHLVIDKNHQGQGLGKIVATSVLASLLALPDCLRVLVAIHPDNSRSRAFFSSLGVQPSDRRNYDGDPMYAFSRDSQ